MARLLERRNRPRRGSGLPSGAPHPIANRPHPDPLNSGFIHRPLHGSVGKEAMLLVSLEPVGGEGSQFVAPFGGMKDEVSQPFGDRFQTVSMVVSVLILAMV